MNSDFFDKLLKKPEAYRRRVAFIATIVIGASIFSVWLIITSQNIQEASIKPLQQDAQTADQLRKSIPSLKDDTAKTQLMPTAEEENVFETELNQRESQSEGEPTVIER